LPVRSVQQTSTKSAHNMRTSDRRSCIHLISASFLRTFIGPLSPKRATWDNQYQISTMRPGLLLALVAALLAACAHRHARATPPPTPAAPSIPSPSLASETGLASWYGHPYHGRASASGEIYDMETLTAAHRTLPFQTQVRVINLD